MVVLPLISLMAEQVATQLKVSAAIVTSEFGVGTVKDDQEFITVL